MKLSDSFLRDCLQIFFVFWTSLYEKHVALALEVDSGSPKRRMSPPCSSGPLQLGKAVGLVPAKELWEQVTLAFPGCVQKNRCVTPQSLFRCPGGPGAHVSQTMRLQNGDSLPA